MFYDAQKAIKNSLLYRYIVLNTFGLAMLALLARNGWLVRIYEADIFHVSKVIGLTFIVAMMMFSNHLLKLNTVMNCTDKIEIRSLLAFRMRLQAAVRVPNVLGYILVLLGLTGTVLGFIAATGAMHADQMQDTAAIGPMFAGLLSGVSAKFYTTLVGTVLNMWIFLNHLLISQSHYQLMAKVAEDNSIDV